MRSEELRFDSVVAVNPGKYDVVLLGTEGETVATSSLVRRVLCVVRPVPSTAPLIYPLFFRMQKETSTNETRSLLCICTHALQGGSRRLP